MLCIIQDSDEDWCNESKRMSSVFGNAFVTIVASAAADCGGGLFWPVSDCDLPVTSSASSTSTENGTKITSIYSWYKDPTAEPIASRGWAFQEWKLSPRWLVFTSFGTIFDCEKIQPSVFIKYIGLYRFEPFHQDWNEYVEDFCSRDLTKPKDKLPAIEGLAENYRHRTGGKYGRTYPACGKRLYRYPYCGKW
ncbi:hypothetical protein F5B20DRAFT_579740 [Whalleya microplaca]|nr:hypothetical protein F5B20DRAFT_579740 [Whalleya microplaca]